MRKKLTILFTLALTATLLGGCGSNSQTETSSGSSSKSIDTLSEHLSDGKTIGYLVKEMDKSNTPDKVYFFENITIIPGDEMGLTLGDLSKMKDKEIWETYETVRTNYQKSYTEEREQALAKEKETTQKYIDALKEVKGKSTDEVEEDVNDMASEAIYGWDDSAYEGTIIGYDDDGNDISTYNDDSVDGALQFYESRLANMVTIGPFYDLPFSFIVTTDASGNYTQKETLVYPTLENDKDGSIPEKFYNELTFIATVEGSEVQIYDTTYGCFPLDNGDTFCTRDLFTFDTAKSKDVLVDPSTDEINKLYEAEVTARYK